MITAVEEFRIPKSFDDILVVCICQSHGIFAPQLEVSPCDGLCRSTAVFATFGQFFEAIAPRNVVIF